MTSLPATVQERIALPGRAPGGGGEQGSTLTAADIFGILRRRIVLIVLLSTLFGALAVAGFIVWYKLFPLYRAHSYIECISNIPETELSVTPGRLTADEHERFVRSQATLLKSPTVLTAALGLKEVQETQWYRETPADERLLRLTDELYAGPVRGTNFLLVSMECSKREDPKTIVNNVVDRWHDAVTKRSADSYKQQLTDAQTELRNLEAEIEGKQEQRKRIAERLPAGAANEGPGNIAAQEVLQYSEQVAMLSLEKSLLEEYRAIYNDPQAPAVTAEDRAAIEQDPEVAMLTQRVFMLKQQIEADAATFGPEHTEVRALQAQLQAAESEADRLRTRKLGERRTEVRESTNTAYQSTQYALFLAQENLAKAMANLQDQDRQLFELRKLEEEIEQNLEYRVKLRDYVKELERVVFSRTAMKASVAERAIDPLERSSPRLLFLPAGVVLAFGLAVGLALLIELLNTSVRTPQDILRHLEVAMLGVIPHIDDEEISIERVETATRDAPRSMVAEGFRRVRTSLQFSAPAEQQRSIVVTSPHPDDGRTTVASNLALAMALAGRRVLLVDANFRRPALRRFYNQVPDQGLSNILIGDSFLTNCAVATDVNGLDVLGSGPIPPNPAELLGSEQFRSFLEDASTRYDHVVIDSPPALLASDAVVASTAVDGVVVVIRAQENSRGAARRACTLLHAVNARIFGAVLNAAQATRGGYFREQLRDYYDYLAEESPSPAALPLAGRQVAPPANDKTENNGDE